MDEMELISFQVFVASPAAASGNGHFTSAAGACHSYLPAVPGDVTGDDVSGSGSKAVDAEHCSAAW